MEDSERQSGQCDLHGCLERLEEDICSFSDAADGICDACKILGYSLDPADESGDEAVDTARGFLSRLVIFLRHVGASRK